MTAPHVNTAIDTTTKVAAPLRWRYMGSFLAWTTIFGLAYTQAPLYFSNQNQYFLHGMAGAGRGYLQEDWLANTRDPTWAFSILVMIVGRWLHEYLFYGIYLVLLGLYFHSLTGIADRCGAAMFTKWERLALATLLVLVHGAILRRASALLWGVDYPWYFQAGVAGQYLLGFGLQPSACGVFLLVSIWAFLRDRPWQAAFWACLAANLHATYLISAGLLVFAYQLSLLRAGRGQQALFVGLGALLLVTPVIYYSWVHFAPSSPEMFAEAQRILAHERIPHHADPDRWCDAIAWGQIAWIVAAIVLTWRTRLFGILATVFVGSLLLTIAQLITGSDTLALLFPWRTSALLMPLATTIILARIVGLIGAAAVRQRDGAPLSDGRGSEHCERRSFALRCVCGITLATCTLGGVAINVFGWGYYTSPEEIPLLDHVRSHKRSGETYLLPVEIPNTAAGPRGAASRNKNFTPAPRRDPDSPHIAVDLQSFRLSTGAPIYVDFKSIPYQDEEVLEWRHRLMWTKDLYARDNWTDAQLAELARAHITHVVLPGNRPVPSAKLQIDYEDDAYRLCRVLATLP
jgi:hypothetical protein